MLFKNRCYHKGNMAVFLWDAFEKLIRAFSNIGTSSPRFEKTAKAVRTRREQYEMFLCS